MQEKQLSKAEVARRMHTSRAALDRLLDPRNESVTLNTLYKAAAAKRTELPRPRSPQWASIPGCRAGGGKAAGWNPSRDRKRAAPARRLNWPLAHGRGSDWFESQHKRGSSRRAKWRWRAGPERQAAGPEAA
jgi:transcriptional regulator with XRE-family HTH domain